MGRGAVGGPTNYPISQIEWSPGDSPVGTCRSCKPWGPAEGENKSEDLGFYNQKLQGCLESRSLQPGGERKGARWHGSLRGEHGYQNVFGGFPGGSAVERPPANAGETALMPGLGGFHMLRSD